MMRFLEGGGEAGHLIRTRDWSETPLGPSVGWPQSLRSALSICLNSSFPTAIYWGAELRLLYNDAWSTIPEDRHPWALGRPAAEVWPDIWEVVGPQFEQVLETGEGFSTYDQMLMMNRSGSRRETYWNYSFTPIRGEDGSVVGIFNQGHETTERVFSERRDRFLLSLTDQLRTLSDPRRIIEAAQASLGTFLNANRVGYGEVDRTARYFTTQHNWTDGSVPSREGTHDLAGFGLDVLTALRNGIPLLITDAATDPRTCAPESLAAFDAIDTRAAITASLVKAGRMRAALYVHARERRPWSDHDAELVTDVADRTWAAVERARSEDRLRRSEARFRALVTAGSYSVYSMSADWREIQSLKGSGAQDDPAEASLGWAERYMVDGDREQAAAAIEEAIRSRGLFELEHRIRRPDGTIGWALSRAVPVLDDDGELVEWVGAASDVTERREAEAALRLSETKFRQMADSAPPIVWITDGDGRVEFFSRRWFEYTGENALPRSAGEVAERFVHPDDAAVTMATFNEARRGAGVYQVEHRIRRSDGVYRWFLVRAYPYRDPETGVISRWFGASTDIDDRKATEAALRASEARMRELNETLEHRVEEVLAERKVFADVVEGIDALVQVIDRDYRIRAINRAMTERFESFFGTRPKVGDRLEALFADHPDQARHFGALWSRALAGEEFTEIGEYQDSAQARRVFEMKFFPLRSANGDPIGAYQFVYDVTERIRDQARLADAEAQLRQAQKMEAVGQLTGGVAHDFNNLLTIIKSSAEFLQRPNLSEERHRRYVDAISETVDRAAKLTGQLLAFARRQALKPEVFDAGARVRAVCDMLRTIVGARIRIDLRVAVEPCFVEVDVSQFETALINIAANARDAMNGEGCLTISVRNLDQAPPSLAEGRYVVVSLRDTGHGIAHERLAQIFEPFYTTKEVGRGTGLGLSQVYGFAKQSRGDVIVDSELGRGTRFSLYLPRAARPEHDHSGPGADSADSAVSHGRGRRILVVEDNLDVGRFSTQILHDLGYSTVWARSGDEALRLLQTEDRFDVVFTDVVMPGMSGVDLGRKIRSRHPDLPIVLTSGYAQVLAEDGRHGFELVHKPYAAEELARVLTRVTSSDPGSGE